MKEATLFERLEKNRVRCNLCAHHCVITDDKRGVCQVRENRDGTLHTLVYGRTISQHVDPVEKKPLYHFYPGSTAYSIAAPGCSFRCQWCQKWDISQMPRDRDLITGNKGSPEQIIVSAKRFGCQSIAYTYTEPTVFFEYTYDTARLAHVAGLANLYITNGCTTAEMLDAFHPYLDAALEDMTSPMGNRFKANVVKPHVWDAAIKRACALVPDEGPGILIFVSALNLLLFSPTYGKGILDKMKATAQGKKQHTYLFSASTTVKAEEIAELEAVVDNLVMTRSTKDPFRLYMQIERIKESGFVSNEIEVPFSADLLTGVKEIADHSRKRVIPLVSKL